MSIGQFWRSWIIIQIFHGYPVSNSLHIGLDCNGVGIRMGFGVGEEERFIGMGLEGGKRVVTMMMVVILVMVKMVITMIKFHITFSIPNITS